MDKREMADLMDTLFDPANMPAIPEWAIKAQEEWLEWASPMMGVSPYMTANGGLGTASAAQFEEELSKPSAWHDNIPEHIDYEALRREL